MPLVWEDRSTSDMVKESLRKKILQKYYTLKFPASFGGVSAFRQSLKDNLNIEISQAALRRILKSSTQYQVNVVKPKKFKTQKNYSRGVFIEAYCDPIFIPYKKDGKSKNFIALIVADVHSRFVYGTKLPRVNPKCLKQAFSRLFKNEMPHFDVVRCDRDRSLNTLRSPYFSSRGILLLTRRSVHHMAFLEGIIRNIKRKFIKNMRNDDNPWTEKRFESALKDTITSINSTVSTAHGFRPASVNSPEFDPVLREKLYGKDARLPRFETFYTETLRRQKKANTPRETPAKPGFKEGENNFKKSNWVYIDWEEDKFARAGYRVQRGPILEVSRVNVLTSPYIYKLRNPQTKREVHGFYYGKELAFAPRND